MATLRIQLGHYARTRGSTGTRSSHFGWTEQEMNVQLGNEIKRAAEAVRDLDVEIVGADLQLGGKPDIFIALHMDGSDSISPAGGSFGHNGTSNSKKFVAILKSNYSALGLPSKLRGDNYTTALSGYYGYKSRYAGWGSGPKIVFENGFLTNRNDARWAKDNQKRVAEAIVKAAAQYLGLVFRSTQSVNAGAGSSENSTTDWYKIIETATGRVLSAAVILMQERLVEWGYSVKIDGLIGPATEQAFQQWAYEHHPLPLDVSKARKRPGAAMWKKLLGKPTPKVAKAKPPAIPTVVTKPADDTLFEARIAALEAEVEKYKRSAQMSANQRQASVAKAKAVLNQIAEIAEDYNG